MAMMQIVRGGGGEGVFCSNYPASPATLFDEARHIVRRGRSYAAASLPSQTPKRKKVSKDEPRALIVSFLTRYRSMNAGKFPSVTAAQKEVGGSYYFVRRILQELEYESKAYSSNSSYKNISGKVVNKEDKSFSVVEVVSTAVKVQDDTCTEAMDDVNMLDTDEKQLEADKVLQVYTLAEETFSEVVLKPSDKQKIVEAFDQDLESEEQCKTESQGVQSDFGVVEGDLLKEETEIGNAEGDEKEQTISKELLNSGIPELKAEHHQQFQKEEKYARNVSCEQSDDAESSKKSNLWGNVSCEQSDDAESSKKSNLWGNLRSIADGIINIWRKL